jgi:hypothetical protein
MAGDWKALFELDSTERRVAIMDVASKLASLREDVEAIHFVNKLYRAQKEHSHAAVAEYERRQERLDQIRNELKEMQEN